MKKGFKILLIVSCILVIVGLIITIAALIFGASESLGDLSAEINKVLGFIDDDFYEPPLDFDGTIAAAPGADSFVSVDLDSDQPIEIDPATIRAINIEWIAGDVIITGGAPEFLIEENNSTSHKTVCILKEGVLYIKYKETMSGINLSAINEKKDIAIRLPITDRNSFDYVSVSGASSKLDIANITANKIDIGTASGDCELFTVNAAELDIGTASGNITLHGVFDNVECSTASGTISGDGEYGKFSADTASGDVMMGGSFGEFSAETASGDVTLLSDHGPYDLDVETASGDVDITVFEDSTLSIVLEFDSGSGKAKSEYFSGKGKHKIGDGRFVAEYEIDTASGDLTFDMR